MKNTAKLFTIAMFAIILFSGLASAVTFESGVRTIDQTSGTFTVTIKSTVDETVTVSVDTITKNSKTITFDSQDIVLTANVAQDVTISYTVESGFDFDFSDGQVTSTIKTTGANAATQTVKFVESSYCGSVENEGDLRVTIEDVSVKEGFGDDDDYFYAQDTIEVELNIDNKGSWDIENIEIEWEMYNDNGEKIMDGDEDDIDLDEGDDETIDVKIKLDEDIEDIIGKEVTFYFKVQGDIDDNKAEDLDGKATCDYAKSKSIEVRDEDFVIVDDLHFNDKEVIDIAQTFSCGEQVTVTGKIYNIGSDDLDETYLEIDSSSLDLYKKLEWDEIDSGDSETFSYTFSIPKETEEKTYKLRFEVLDEDKDVFENKEDDKSTRTIQFKVEGNCKVVEPKMAIKPLDVLPKSGEEFKVTTTITNMNDKNALYTLNADGFQEWATLKDLSSEAITLASGESKEVTFTMVAKKDAVGDKYFNIEVIEGAQTVLSQSVSVTVEESSALGNVEDLFNKKNLQIGGIVLLNLILLVAIILVARKILSKK